MEKNGDKQPELASTPSIRESKRAREEVSSDAISLPEITMDVLLSIEKKLDSFDARLNLVEILHREFQQLRESLEFSQKQVETLAAENADLKVSVKTLTEGINQISADNKKLKESIIDLQARSMRDNLVFAGIPEKADENPEETIKTFIHKELKLPLVTVNSIGFHRVHRIGGKRPDSRRPRPIVAKFVSFKQKEQVKKQGRELKGTNFGVNDQFPKEILDRRRALFPIRKKAITEGARAVIAVDKLFINGHLYRDSNITPWLF